MSRPTLPRRFPFCTLPALLAFAFCFGFTLPVNAEHAVLKTITIDGDFEDWAEVLSNSFQVSLDGDGSGFGQDCVGSTDRDCQPGDPVQSVGRDLARMAWTYDEDYLYFYDQRHAQENQPEYFFLFLDLDGNARMDATDFVFRARHKSQSKKDLARYRMYDYVPEDPVNGDSMVTTALPGCNAVTSLDRIVGCADGWTLPGDAVNERAIPELADDNGDGPDGRTFEFRLPWSALGSPPALFPGATLHFHAQSTNNQKISGSVADNMGDLIGALGVIGYLDVDIESDERSPARLGGTLTYTHRIWNRSSLASRFTLKASSSLGLAIGLVWDEDCNPGTADVSIATDFNGSLEPSDIDPGWLAMGYVDAAGQPTTPVLPPDPDHPGLDPTGASEGPFCLIVELDTSNGIAPAEDQTLVSLSHLTSTGETAERPTDFVRDRTTISQGAIALGPNGNRSTVLGGVVPYPFEVCNYGATNDTVDLTSFSSEAWPATLLTDPDCDGDSSDGSPATATGNLPPTSCACFVAELLAQTEVPDTTTVSGVGRNSGDTGIITLNTSLALSPLELLPVGGYLYDPDPGLDLSKRAPAGRMVFFRHDVRNHLATRPMSITITQEPVAASYRLWTDPNADGNPADGREITSSLLTDPVPGFGGKGSFLVGMLLAEGSMIVEDTLSLTVSNVSGGVLPSTDDMLLSDLLSFRDPAFAIPATQFAPCSTVYLEASNLQRQNQQHLGGVSYELHLHDSAGELAATLDLFPNADQYAQAQYALSDGDPIGLWRTRIEQIVDKGNSTIRDENYKSGRFEVAGDSAIDPLTTNKEVYDLRIPEDLRVHVTSKLSNYTLDAPFPAPSIRYVLLGINEQGVAVYFDPTDAQDPWKPWSEGVFTAIRTPIDCQPVLMPLTSCSDSFPLNTEDPGAGVPFSHPTDPDAPGGGQYAVIASLVADCGALLAENSTTFTVVEGEDCDNGIDDDNDGLIDCEDPDCPCKETDPCIATGIDPDICCSDGKDNDFDGPIDCFDPDCDCHEDDPPCDSATDPNCCTDPTDCCSDREDNDSDGPVDCADPDCADTPPCLPEHLCLEYETDPDQINLCCSDGVDNDIDGPVDCEDLDCCVNAPDVCGICEKCEDGVDNDGDGLAECEDPDTWLICCNCDFDGDGVYNCVDCAPSDPETWDTPGEVANLRVDRTMSNDGMNTEVRLHWELPYPGGSTPSYDLAYGWVGPLRVGGLGYRLTDCLAAELPTDSFTTTSVPGTGTHEICTDDEDNDRDGLIDCEDPECLHLPDCGGPNGIYFLIRARNDCGLGTYGDSGLQPDPRDLLDDPFADPCPRL